MRDTNEEYWEVVKGAVGALIVLAIFIIFFLSGCRILKNEKIATKDSTSINNSKEGSVKIDSSGSKSENTKETVYYPQPIYIEGKNGESKIIFVPQSVKETGKTEQAQIIRDTSWKEAIREMTLALKDKELEKKTKVGFSLFEWIVLGVIAFFLLRPFITKFLIKT